jgi:hypothetical protein
MYRYQTPSIGLWASVMQNTPFNSETLDIFYQKCKLIAEKNSFIFTLRFLKNDEIDSQYVTVNAFNYINMKPNTTEPNIKQWQSAFGEDWYNYGFNRKHIFLYQTRLIDEVEKLNQEYTKKRLDYTKKYISLQKLEGTVDESDNRLISFKKSIETTQLQIISLFEEMLKTSPAVINDLKRLNNEKFSFTRDMCKAIDEKLNIKCLGF